VKRSPEEESKGGFLQATIFSGGRIMCITADQCLLFYESVDGEELRLYKRLIGYNEEIIDLKFVGEDATRLAVATNLEQV
jgi:U3 small nucleolar RNA-associated protein 13